MPVITYTMNHTLVLTVDGELNNDMVEEIRPIIDALIQKHTDVLVVSVRWVLLMLLVLAL